MTRKIPLSSVSVFFVFMFAATSWAQVPGGEAVVIQDTPLRLYPDTTTRPVLMIEKGVKVRINRVEGEWVIVTVSGSQLGDRTGYVETKYLQSASSSATAARPSASPQQQRAPATASVPPAQPTNGLQQYGTLQIQVRLVDKELAVRPVPLHALVIKSPSGIELKRLTSGLDGKVQEALPTGEYVVESDSPVDFQDRSYSWSQRVVIDVNKTSQLDLGNQNAVVGGVGAVKPTPAAELPALFRRWQGSVVTVWSDTGHGSGFVIDGRGLIATNQHVVGVSEYAAVQFNNSLKVPAKIVSKSPDKDVAILLVNPKYVHDVQPVTLGYSSGGALPAVEGEQVFTIGSPLNQSKIMTSGIVSKIEAHAIISDVNINHGNSGGPLFTMRGVVVGITTFGDFSDQGGPGISGVVRIDEARDSIEQAKATSVQPPGEGTLPVEPTLAYPLPALKEAVSARPIKPADYVFSTGDFEVATITPVLNYGVQYAQQQAALKERAKRNKNAGSIQGTTDDAFAQYKNWAEYVGEFRPVIIIDARPKLVEGFWSAFGRGMAASQGVYAGPANLHFKSDFYRMTLTCGEREVTPIHPGKVEHRVAASNAAVNVNDVSFEGFYSFSPDAIRPDCGTVKLTFYTEKEPEKGDTKVLPPKLVQRIFDDFAPYRQAANGSR
jgi:S1-C subfamily serine protease